MSRSLTETEIEELTVPQRLELIGRLWDSIPEGEEATDIPEWHVEELEKRLASAEAAPGASAPWEEVRERLRQRP